MAINFKKIEGESDYQILVEKFYFLADMEIKKYEELMVKNDHHQIALSLPKLISVVNLVGYFRGQDNMFFDFRPLHVSYQNELYKIENIFEDRLCKLIDFVLLSPSKDIYKWSLEEYYIKSRGFRE